MQGHSAARQAAYFDKYENLALSRDEEGVLVLRFHTDGGPVVFTGQTHQDFPAALEELSLDRDNRALVITGTGDSFMDEIDGPSLGEIFKPAAWEKPAWRVARCCSVCWTCRCPRSASPTNRDRPF